VDLPDVGVDEHNAITLRDEHGLPQRVALAADGLDVQQDIGLLVHGSSCIGCTVGRSVGGAGVDHDHLVHQGNLVHEITTDGPHDVPHRLGLAPGGQAD